jgi:hypothetical protein
MVYMLLGNDCKTTAKNILQKLKGEGAEALMRIFK